jgi:hypothetical protein
MNQQTTQNLLELIPPGAQPGFRDGANFMIGCFATYAWMSSQPTTQRQNLAANGQAQPATQRQRTTTTKRSTTSQISNSAANLAPGSLSEKVYLAISGNPGITTADLPMQVFDNPEEQTSSRSLQRIGTLLARTSPNSLFKKGLVTGDQNGWFAAQTTAATNIQTARGRGRPRRAAASQQTTAEARTGT